MIEVERFRQLIAQRVGLAFDDSKLGVLGELLRRRADAAGLDADGYLTRLALASGEELGALAVELTVPETYFFRNLDQFRALAEVALPERMRAQPARRLVRLLSAACASGEEAYSLAIIARAAVPAGWQVSVRAADLNPAVLARAARGRYTSWSMRETPDEQRRWFRTDGHELVLDDSIRGAVVFEQRNLAQDDPELWPPASYDVVFCRNLLMYFTPAHATALVARIAGALVPGGYLFLGHAETLRGLSNDFHLCHTHGTFYYRRKGAGEPELAPRPEPAAAAILPALVEQSTSWIDSIRTASEKIDALTRPAPAVTSVPAARKPDLGGALELLRTERFAEALDELRRLPPEAAGDPDVLMVEAVLLTHRGHTAEAAAICRHLLAIDELSAGAHYVLALCCEAGDDHRGAVDHDQVATYLDPAFAMPRLHLGLLARRAGDREAARRELGHALVLLQREDASRVLLFGGGFGRAALAALCAAELRAAGERP